MRLSPIEMKFLIYEKIKNNGLTYDEARKEVSRDIEHLKVMTKKEREAKKMKKSKKKDLFKTDFQKLCTGGTIKIKATKK